MVHRQNSWLGASPDGLVGADGLLEIKCPQKLPEEVPPYHVVQCQVQMACCSRAWCDYLAFVGPGQIMEKRFYRNLAVEYALLQKLREWYEKYVRGNVEPPYKLRIKHFKEEP